MEKHARTESAHNSSEKSLQRDTPGFKTIFFQRPLNAFRRKSCQGVGSATEEYVDGTVLLSPRGFAKPREAGGPTVSSLQASTSIAGRTTLPPTVQDDYMDFMRGKKQPKYIPFEQYDVASQNYALDDTFYEGSGAQKRAALKVKTAEPIPGSSNSTGL